MNHVDLCSGIGGWALAFRELGINTVAFCEIDKYPRQVLQKNFPSVPIFNDLKELTYEDIKERTGVDGIDILTCSYPCQPFSVAGKQKGEEDPRHLWPDTFRIVQECRPTWFVGENVSGHIKLGLDTVLEDLASEGYDTRTFIIPASSVGAWHKRERLWIVGYSEHNGQSAKKIRRKLQKNNQRGKEEESHSPRESEGASRPSSQSLDDRSQTGCESNPRRDERRDVSEVRSGTNTDVSDTENRGREQTKSERGKSIRGRSDDRSWTKRERKNTKATDVPDTDQQRTQIPLEGQQSSIEMSGSSSKENWWQTQSKLCGVPDGISYELDKGRVGRIKGLGNAIVPQIAYYIGYSILQSNKK